ncbi:hypothetical protein AB0L13_39585 [Saccharopolyspora shandongensis]|uniref:hypothetical protein n=1 Tax=Saccharopolyspora shandongensis TaxID=418495 RepID=UPI00341D8860
MQFDNIALPYAPFPKTLPQDEAAAIFSWVHNNLWDTDFPGVMLRLRSFAEEPITCLIRGRLWSTMNVSGFWPYWSAREN